MTVIDKRLADPERKPAMTRGVKRGPNFHGVVTTLRLPHDLIGRLTVEATRAGLSRSEFIRRVLEDSAHPGCPGGEVTFRGSQEEWIEVIRHLIEANNLRLASTVSHLLEGTHRESTVNMTFGEDGGEARSVYAAFQELLRTRKEVNARIL